MLPLLVAMWTININYHAFIFYSSFMVALLLRPLLRLLEWMTTVCALYCKRNKKWKASKNVSKLKPDRDEFIFVHRLCCIAMATVIKIFYVLEIIVNYYKPSQAPPPWQPAHEKHFETSPRCKSRFCWTSLFRIISTPQTGCTRRIRKYIMKSQLKKR